MSVAVCRVVSDIGHHLGHHVVEFMLLLTPLLHMCVSQKLESCLTSVNNAIQESNKCDAIDALEGWATSADAFELLLLISETTDWPSLTRISEATTSAYECLRRYARGGVLRRVYQKCRLVPTNVLYCTTGTRTAPESNVGAL